MDINEGDNFVASYERWYWSLSAQERQSIMNRVIDHYYPDSFNGFVQDAEAGALDLGIQHGC